MSHSEVVSSVSKTSIHEDIIREVEETDWSVDPVEDDDAHMCTTASAKIVGVDASKSDLDTETDDVDFDPDELECVDEDAEEERRDREVMDDQTRSENHKYRRTHRRSSRDRHRHHPYSRKDWRNQCELRRSGDMHRRYNRFEENCLMSSKQWSSHEFKRATARGRVRSPSFDRTRRNRRECDDKDIPLEELELEEVDCCDEVGDDDSNFVGGASGIREFRSGDDGDHNDDKLCPTDCGMSNVDDDFPDLCEDIDVDAMRRAAAATNIVSSSGECDSSDTSLPKRKDASTCETTRRDENDSHQIGIATSRNNRSTIINGRQEDEARRRRPHNVSRNELSRSMQSKRRNYESEGRDRFYENPECLRDVRSPSSKQACLREKKVRCDSDFFSVKGPLSCGWCPVDNEKEISKISIDNTKLYSKNDEELTTGRLLRCRFACDTEGSRFGRTMKIKSSSIIRKDLSPPKDRESVTPVGSSKNDGQAEKKIEDHCLMQQEITSTESTNRHCPEKKNENAIGVTEKIPSLLDMCVKDPKQLQTSQLTSLTDGLTSRISFSLVDGVSHRPRCVDNKTECISDLRRSRSLLDLDIPPPDHKTMRQYAISLDNRELTRRPIEKKSGKNLMLSTKYERSRQPRPYVHRAHRVQ